MNEPVQEQGQPILCGKCKQPISHQVEDDVTSLVGCATCNNWATLAVATSEAADYALDAAGVVLAQQMLAATKGNRDVLSFTPSASSKRLSKSYRFIYGGIL